jgi:tripartite ATP-independent transporter DctP family solute receptor
VIYDWIAKRCTLPLLVLLLFISMGCSADQDETVIRLGHALSPSHPVHKAMADMGERLAEKSDGTMRVEIYPSGQLGSERELLELLQVGSLDITKVSSAVMEGFSDSYKVFGLPYLFRSDAHRYAVMDGEIGQKILLSSQDVWLRGLTFYDAGSRSFYTNTPIRKPSDLQGLKIRTMNSPVAIRMVNEMGGSATPISFGELYSALQQGVVDGAENNPPSFHLTNHYELCDYYILDKHTSPQDVLLASTHLWERLTPQEQEWLQEAANESAQYQKKLWEKATQEALRTVKKAGVEIIRPDMEPFVEAVQPVYDFYEENEPQVYELAQEVRAVEVDSTQKASGEEPSGDGPPAK